jgi:hypothetical protein
MIWRMLYLYYVLQIILFNLHSGGVESKLGPLGTPATYWPIVPAPGDCEDGEFGGMNGRGNRSTRRNPAPTPLRPPQIPLDQSRDWTRAAEVGRQRLTASAMARPLWRLTRRSPFTPQEDSWYSFLLEADCESTPAPQCGWKSPLQRPTNQSVLFT